MVEVCVLNRPERPTHLAASDDIALVAHACTELTFTWTRMKIRHSFVFRQFLDCSVDANLHRTIQNKDFSCRRQTAQCFVSLTHTKIFQGETSFASSSTSQLISVIIHTLVVHHSFTLSLQAQNLPFQQILPTVDFFTYWTAS